MRAQNNEIMLVAFIRSLASRSYQSCSAALRPQCFGCAYSRTSVESPLAKSGSHRIIFDDLVVRVAKTKGGADTSIIYGSVLSFLRVVCRVAEVKQSIAPLIHWFAKTRHSTSWVETAAASRAAGGRRHHCRRTSYGNIVAVLSTVRTGRTAKAQSPLKRGLRCQSCCSSSRVSRPTTTITVRSNTRRSTGCLQVFPFQNRYEAACRGCILGSSAEGQQIVDLQHLCPELLRQSKDASGRVNLRGCG